MDIDKELLQACIREERRAQFELYKCCYSVLMSVCLRYERNKEDAEFMLNKVFYKILTHLDRYDEKAPLRPGSEELPSIHRWMNSGRKAEARSITTKPQWIWRL